MNIGINNNAPIVAKQTVKINAPVENVWRILTSINNWPAWQSSVSEAHLMGPLKLGAEFEWKAGGLTLRSKIHTCDRCRSFGWTGKTIGAYAIHNWSFVEEANTTTVSVEESLEGFLPRLFRKRFQKNLDQGMATNLEELKVASERLP